jgi:hypothetical protein
VVNGIVLQAELFAGDGTTTVRVFVDIDDDGDTLHVRRSYGERAAIASFDLADVTAALAQLRAEHARRPPEPIEGQLEMDGE